ncbi:hypothetical protein Pelo_13669 [Pelomyxa schiedti]|nr:hypothetical protein Pelo_13669 [Pelomyxa schiedti]
MKRYRFANGTPATAPDQQLPQSACSGIDQVMPPALMDAIVGWLLLPPFPGDPPSVRVHTSADFVELVDTTIGRNRNKGNPTPSHNMGSFFSFALCSKTCLGACERLSALMRARAAIRENNMLVGSCCDSDPRLAVMGYTRDLTELKAVQDFVNKVVDDKHWRRCFQVSVVKTMPRRRGAGNGQRPCGFQRGAMLIWNDEDFVPGEDNTQVHKQCGAMWFYSAGSNCTERTFVYCCGTLSEDRLCPVDSQVEMYRAVCATLWYCTLCCEKCPPKPPGWSSTSFPCVPTQGKELGQDCMPWMHLASVSNPGHGTGWEVYDGVKGRTNDLVHNNRIDHFCRLVDSPAASREHRCALLDEVVKFAKCEDLVATPGYDE